jgi:hypothetical protein
LFVGDSVGVGGDVGEGGGAEGGELGGEVGVVGGGAGGERGEVVGGAVVDPTRTVVDEGVETVESND